MKFFTRLKDFYLLVIQAIRGEQQDYTSGGINRAIILLSVPMIMEMIMESIFAVVDVYFVSRLHDNDALAAVGLTESVLTLIYSLAFGLSMGATALVARRVGEKDIKGAKEAATQAIYVSVAVSIVLSLIGIFFYQNILSLMGASPELISSNGGYTRIMFSGNITIMLLFMINAIFRGAGDASLAMRALLLANGLNIVLDPLLIFGFGPIPAFGVEGAAIATNIGRGVGVAYQLYHLTKGSSLINIRFNVIKANVVLIRKLLGVSSGATGQFLIGSASWIFLMRIMADFGSAALAGYIIAIRIIIFAILPAWGMANASATLVGQNLGAGQPERAEKSVWRAGLMNMIFLAFVTVLFFTMADFIIHFFSEDATVLHHGVQCLQIVSLGYIFYAYGMVITQSFNGAGDTKTPTFISLAGFWAFQIPLAYLLAKVFHAGPVGVYAAISIAESVMALVAIYIFRQGRWKSIKI